MNRLFVFASILVLLAGCAQGEESTPQSKVRVFDVGDGVKCYKWARNRGLSCVKVTNHD